MLMLKDLKLEDIIYQNVIMSIDSDIKRYEEK